MMILAPVEDAGRVRCIGPVLGPRGCRHAAGMQEDDIEQFQTHGWRGVVRQERGRGPRIGAGEQPHPVSPAHRPAGPVRIGKARGQQDHLMLRLQRIELLAAPVGTALIRDSATDTHSGQGRGQFLGAIVEIDRRRGADQGEDLGLRA